MKAADAVLKGENCLILCDMGRSRYEISFKVLLVLVFEISFKVLLVLACCDKILQIDGPCFGCRASCEIRCQ